MSELWTKITSMLGDYFNRTDVPISAIIVPGIVFLVFLIIYLRKHSTAALVISIISFILFISVVIAAFIFRILLFGAMIFLFCLSGYESDGESSSNESGSGGSNSDIDYSTKSKPKAEIYKGNYFTDAKGYRREYGKDQFFDNRLNLTQSGKPFFDSDGNYIINEFPFHDWSDD